MPRSQTLVGRSNPGLVRTTASTVPSKKKPGDVAGPESLQRERLGWWMVESQGSAKESTNPKAA